MVLYNQETSHLVLETAFYYFFNNFNNFYPLSFIFLLLKFLLTKLLTFFSISHLFIFLFYFLENCFLNAILQIHLWTFQFLLSQISCQKALMFYFHSSLTFVKVICFLCENHNYIHVLCILLLLLCLLHVCVFYWLVLVSVFHVRGFLEIQ